MGSSPRSRLKLLCCASLFLFSLGCDASNADKWVEIGHVSEPGPVGDEELALKLAVEELNADMSKQPEGRRIVVRHAPGGTKPEEWGAQASRLISLNRVNGLIVGGQAPETEKIAQAIQGDGVVATSTAGWPGLASRNLFTVGVSPEERGRVLALVAKEMKPKSVLILREPTAKAVNLAADRFAVDMRAAGKAVTEMDLTAEDKPAADLVFLASSARMALKHRPKGTKAFFGGGDKELSELLAAGPSADGFHVAVAYDPSFKSDRAAAFAVKFQQAHGRSPSVAAMLAHDALSVWIEAARRANSYDLDPLRGELVKPEASFNVLTGSLTFADDHTARRPIFVGKVASGQLGDVKEFAAAKAK